MDFYDENIVHLISRAIAGELSNEERLQLENWSKSSPKHALLLEKIKREIHISSENNLPILDDKTAWQQLKRKKQHHDRVLHLHRLSYYAAIIALPLIMAIGILFVKYNGNDYHSMRKTPTDIIKPAKQQVTLVTSNQKKYELEEEYAGKDIVLDAGIIIKNKTDYLEYKTDTANNGKELIINTLKVPYGKEFQIRLSDGTNVYMNAASELKYPAAFCKENRIVHLSGEAYFEVTKETGRPFYVVANDIQIQVYGTSFNVNTHSLNHIETVLVEGEIGLKRKGASQEVRMKPGQLASYNCANGNVELMEVDVQQYIAWKNGYFAFDGKSLEEIMATLSLWYDVEVFFQNKAAKKLVFTGSMKKYSDISRILNAMTEIVGVHFIIQGRTITVVN